MNPDHLRMNESAVRFVREFFRAKKPVAAICHAAARSRAVASLERM
jgi:protease I